MSRQKSKEKIQNVTRRHFLKVTGTVILVAGTGGPFAIAGTGSMAPSDGYILVDTKKCQGCVTCMLACSLVHEGVESLSLSRIQIIQNPFGAYPDDLTIEQCRQCVDPACVTECPEDALTVNADHGNVRMVDAKKCVGCGTCIEACPFTPSRPLLMEDDQYEGELKARKCDLCANTPYHWDKKGGGPGGQQACVEVCPVGAIKFTRTIPVQKGDKGYKVNLRDANWARLGFPTT
jgi:protein NrfC